MVKFPAASVYSAPRVPASKRTGVSAAPQFSGLSRYTASAVMMVGGLVGLAPSLYWSADHLKKELKPAIHNKLDVTIDKAVDRAVDNSDVMVKQLAHLLLEKMSVKMNESKAAMKEKAANFFKSMVGKGSTQDKSAPEDKAQLEWGMMFHEIKEKDLDGLVDVLLHEGSTGKAAEELKEKLKVILKTNIRASMAKQQDKPAVFDETYDEIFQVLKTEGTKAGIPPFLCLAMFTLGALLNRPIEKK